VPPPAPAPSDRGGAGESCRARADCLPGLACVQNVCRDRSAEPEPATPLEAPPGAENPHEPRLQIDLDEMLFQRQVSVVGIDFDGTVTRASNGKTSTYASSVLGASYRFADLELETKIPFLVFAVDEGNSGAPLVAGNVELGASYVKTAHDYEMKIGALFTLPTAPATTEVFFGFPGEAVVVHRDYLDEASWSRGWDRAWLWSSHAFTPFAPSFRIGSRRDAVFQHATELVAAPLITFDPGSSTIPFIVQLSEDLGARLDVLRMGLRAEVAGNLTSPARAQLSLLPYAGVDTGSFFGDVGALFNTQDPVAMGASVDGQVSWALRLRAGGRF
jgi:hypothetical protein